MIMMSPFAVAVLSLSMSADAFAAAIGRGAQHRPTVPQALRSGLVFGVVEAITPWSASPWAWRPQASSRRSTTGSPSACWARSAPG
ncbi:hypothetical protein V8F63_03370 [Brevundimonas sp. LF-1]|uniref:hypothetical protein n=1 Tax=Brevundimonas sp. LF-1 TaxID=3126100 RepID=UPI0030DEE545